MRRADTIVPVWARQGPSVVGKPFSAAGAPAPAHPYLLKSIKLFRGFSLRKQG
jgi:hypothetical protein